MIQVSSKKICLISLGCPKNLVDSEMMLGFLSKDGFSFTRQPENAEIIIINTCGFIEASKKESIEKILEMAEYKKKGVCKILVAAGCLSQRYSGELAQEMPEVDLFVGTGEFNKIGNFIKEKTSTSSSKVYVNKEQILPDPDLPRILATPKHYSYLKISEGCSHRCSFCIIPHIRGDLKSRPISSIIREVETLIDKGVKEFNLIAQDLNEYGKDLRDGSSLTKLWEALEKVNGDFWLRPLYMYPLEFTDRLIATLKESEHFTKYIDMPLQHINDRIMRSMKRGSPSRYVRQVLDKLKTAIPEITIRTTFIVGYPGETEEEFQELYDFVKDYEFDRVGVFQYSIEEGTVAATLPDQLPKKIKEERFDRLMRLQQKISLNKNQALIGKKIRALSEGNQARLSSQAPEIDGFTELRQTSATVGNFINVKIVEAKEYDLVGEIC